MNERIRELWSQAGGHYNSGNQHTWSEYTITDPEKFAELIIKECENLNKKQSYELSGVIADTEQFGGFDLVCLDTVKRVEQYLHGKDLMKHFVLGK